MTDGRYDITLTSAQDEWVKNRLATGGYQSATDYFRELVRLDQRRGLVEQSLRDEEPDEIPLKDDSPGRSSVWESAANRYKGK